MIFDLNMHVWKVSKLLITINSEIRGQMEGNGSY